MSSGGFSVSRHGFWPRVLHRGKQKHSSWYVVYLSITVKFCIFYFFVGPLCYNVLPFMSYLLLIDPWRDDPEVSSCDEQEDGEEHEDQEGNDEVPKKDDMYTGVTNMPLNLTHHRYFSPFLQKAGICLSQRKASVSSPSCSFITILHSISCYLPSFFFSFSFWRISIMTFEGKK